MCFFFNKALLIFDVKLNRHGISQRGYPHATPYMDGVSMISQCPVLANTYFEYK